MVYILQYVTQSSWIKLLMAQRKPGQSSPIKENMLLMQSAVVVWECISFNRSQKPPVCEVFVCCAHACINPSIVFTPLKGQSNFINNVFIDKLLVMPQPLFPLSCLPHNRQ